MCKRLSFFFSLLQARLAPTARDWEKAEHESRSVGQAITKKRKRKARWGGGKWETHPLLVCKHTRRAFFGADKIALEICKFASSPIIFIIIFFIYTRCVTLPGGLQRCFNDFIDAFFLVYNLDTSMTLVDIILSPTLEILFSINITLDSSLKILFLYILCKRVNTSDDIKEVNYFEQTLKKKNYSAFSPDFAV